MRTIILFNALDGNVVTRSKLIKLQRLAAKERSLEVVTRIGSLLDNYPDDSVFDISIANKIPALAAPNSDICENRVKCIGIKKDGSLRKGYLYGKNGVVKKYRKPKAKPALAASVSDLIVYVPVKVIEPYKEHDRETEKKWGSTDTTLDELTDEIKKSGIIKNPITLQVDMDGNALIVEGNTRLAAAKRLGIKNIPVRVRYDWFGNINKHKTKKISSSPELVKVLKGLLPEKTALAAPGSDTCTNRVKCTGIKKDGTLRKGYLYSKNGVVKKYRKPKEAPKKKATAGDGPPKALKPEKALFGPYKKRTRKKIITLSAPEPEIVSLSMKPITVSAGDVGGQLAPVLATKSKNPGEFITVAERLQEFKQKNRKFYHIQDPETAAFLGRVEEKETGSIGITIAGEQGSSKTRGGFQLLNAFAESGYKCAHISLEEEPDSYLYEEKALKYFSEEATKNIDAPNLDKDNIAEKLPKLIENNQVILIDSFKKLRQYMPGFDLDNDLRKKYNGKIFIVIFQLTTDGKMKGGSDAQFDGDIIIFAKKFPDYKENYFFFDKNRYHTTPLCEVAYNVFQQKVINPSAAGYEMPTTLNVTI